MYGRSRNDVKLGFPFAASATSAIGENRAARRRDGPACKTATRSAVYTRVDRRAEGVCIGFKPVPRVEISGKCNASVRRHRRFYPANENVRVSVLRVPGQEKKNDPRYNRIISTTICLEKNKIIIIRIVVKPTRSSQRS